jgi:hypothetical protein
MRFCFIPRLFILRAGIYVFSAFSSIFFCFFETVELMIDRDLVLFCDGRELAVNAENADENPRKASVLAPKKAPEASIVIRTRFDQDKIATKPKGEPQDMEPIKNHESLKNDHDSSL